MTTAEYKCAIANGLVLKARPIGRAIAAIAPYAADISSEQRLIGRFAYPLSSTMTASAVCSPMRAFGGEALRQFSSVRACLIASARRDGIAGRGERDGDSVAHSREHKTAISRERVLQYFIVADHGGLHRLRILLPHARGPLEVGEKKGHRA